MLTPSLLLPLALSIYFMWNYHRSHYSALESLKVASACVCVSGSAAFPSEQKELMKHWHAVRYQCLTHTHSLVCCKPTWTVIIQEAQCWRLSRAELGCDLMPLPGMCRIHVEIGCSHELHQTKADGDLYWPKHGTSVWMCFDTGRGAGCAVQLQTAYYEVLLLLKKGWEGRLVICHHSDSFCWSMGFVTLVPPQYNVVLV